MIFFPRYGGIPWAKTRRSVGGSRMTSSGLMRLRSTSLPLRFRFVRPTENLLPLVETLSFQMDSFPTTSEKVLALLMSPGA